MKTRPLGNTGIEVSEVGLGCWQLGSDCWGDVDEARAGAILQTAVDEGITFFDTADVYGAGLSERRIGAFIKTHPGITVATKLGRSAEVFPSNYSLDTLRACTEDSLANLGLDTLDLSQLHCLTQEELDRGAAFDAMRALQAEGLVRHWGVSVESMDQALQCLEQDGMCSLQIIFNIFRQTPIERLFDRAAERGVAIIVRLPLASGLLTGKFSAGAAFAGNDHRGFNENGKHFNVGETFAGLGFENGVKLAKRAAEILPETGNRAAQAIRWILDHEAVSVVIPGATRPEQVVSNASASALPALDEAVHEQLRAFYRDEVEALVRGAY